MCQPCSGFIFNKYAKQSPGNFAQTGRANTPLGESFSFMACVGARCARCARCWAEVEQRTGVRSGEHRVGGRRASSAPV